MRSSVLWRTRMRKSRQILLALRWLPGVLRLIGGFRLGQSCHFRDGSMAVRESMAITKVIYAFFLLGFLFAKGKKH